MQHSTQVAITRQLLDWMESGATQVAGDRMANPVADYIDPDQFARERERIFRRLPIAVCLARDLREPGDYVTSRDTGVPVLVVRREDGGLEAFINACRHRGTLLVAEGCGRTEGRFVCPYHHWTYDTRGRLVAVPMEFGFPELDRAERGLVPLPVVERFGLVWVAATPGAEIDLDAYLGEALVAELEHYRFDRYHPFKRTTIPAAMNWKLMYDTFLEFYHAYFTHARTLRHLMTRNLVHLERLGNHYRMVAAKQSIGRLREAPESDWDLLEHAVVSYDIFPNLAINFHGDHVAFYRVFPDGARADASLWHFAMLLPEPAESEKAIRYFEKNFDYIVETGAEDVAMGERIQQTLDSGANESVLYGGFEPILTWFHRRVASTVA